MQELEMLRETEQRCKQLLAEAEREALHIEADAKREAEREREKFEGIARRDGEALLEKIRLEAAAEKQVQLEIKKAEIESMWQGSEEKIAAAAKRLMERMCSSDDRTDEPLPASGAETG
jgi:hypothetical protein